MVPFTASSSPIGTATTVRSGRALLRRCLWAVPLFLLVLSSCPFLLKNDLALAHQAQDAAPQDTQTSGPPAESQPLPQSRESSPPLDTIARNFAQRLSDALGTPAPEDGLGSYGIKKSIDFLTAPATWLLVLAVLFFWWYRRPLDTFLLNLKSIKVGEIELTRERLDEIKWEFAEWNVDSFGTLGTPAQGEVILLDFFSLRAYPAYKIGITLSHPYFSLDWQRWLPWLKEREVRLALEESRVRTSPYFLDPNPPKDFDAVKTQLFSFFLCLGNLYGFAKAPPSSPPRITRPIDLETAVNYLQRAIALSPRSGIGYAYFCLGAIRGLLGLELFDLGIHNPVLQGEARALMRGAIEDLQQAEKNGMRTASQYHLQGYLLFLLEETADAAQAWKTAAVMIGTSPKMYFNYACALAKLKQYTEALTALEEAVALDDALFAQNPGGYPRFDARRKSQEMAEGAEFAPFWPGSADLRAQHARSRTGKTFREITA